MPGRKSKYSPELNAQLEMETIGILNESPDALTIQQICERSVLLSQHTPQKMARILSHLVEAGLVTKAQNKTLKRMVYKAVSVMLEQGYEVNI